MSDEGGIALAIERARTLRAWLAFAIDDLERARTGATTPADDDAHELVRRIDAVWDRTFGVGPDDERATLALVMRAINLEAKMPKGTALQRHVGDRIVDGSVYGQWDTEPGACALSFVESVRPDLGLELEAKRRLLVAAIVSWRLGPRGRGPQAKWTAFDELARAIRLGRSKADYRDIARRTFDDEDPVKSK